MSAPTLYTTIPSPLGELLLTGSERALTGLWLQDGGRPRRVEPDWVRSDRAFEATRRQLAEYFAGERRRFELELDPAGTPFRRRVWRLLAGVPYGTTLSYGELAARLGRPGAARAVGAANGANPISIVIPCHRLVGSDGSLTGYGGGIERKRSLLDLERGEPDAPYTLIGGDGVPYRSAAPGTLGGHRRSRVYGRLECAGARRWIARGHYVSHRVFFADEETAIAAGYRPCAGCMPERYRAWKASRS